MRVLSVKRSFIELSEEGRRNFLLGLADRFRFLTDFLEVNRRAGRTRVGITSDAHYTALFIGRLVHCDGRSSGVTID